MTVTRLPEIEYRILAALEAGKSLMVADIVKQTGTDQSLVMAGATLLAQRGLVEVSEESQEEFSLTPEGQLMTGRLPEREALEMLAQSGGQFSMASLPGLLNKRDIRSEIKWLCK
jgi:predicted transcriptional regulator